MNFIDKLRNLFRRSQIEAEMTAEMRHHVDLQTELNVTAGMNPDEARYAALRQFGNVASIQEQAREARSWILLEQLLQDFRYALRGLGRNPGFTFVAIATLALGLGINTALFSVFNAVALRSLPLAHPEELVDVVGRNEMGSRIDSSYSDYADLRAAQHSLAGLAACKEVVVPMDPTQLNAASFILDKNNGGDAARVSVQLVSDNYFSVLGGEVMLGRGILPEENARPGTHPVIVLQHQFWLQQFHADPEVLGKTITLRDVTFTVIGVMAPEFVGKTPAPPIGWISAMMADALVGNGSNSLANFGNTIFQLVGRLQPGVSREQARAELEVLIRQLAEKSPDSRRKTRIELRDCATFLAMPLNMKTIIGTSPVWLSFVLVLVVACANVANLLLARATTRQHEIGVRLALGATRGRIVRHLLGESLIVALIGGLSGLLTTTWMLHAIRPALVAAIPPMMRGTRDWLFLDLTPDYRVFAFTLIMALLAAVIAGLFPALQVARADVNSALKNSGGVLTARSRLRHGLVVAQVALCLTLLVVSGLLVSHVVQFALIDTGLNTADVHVADLRTLPANFTTLTGANRDRIVEASQTLASKREAMELARTLPGITGVAAIYRVPFSGRMRLTPVTLEGQPPRDLPLMAQFNLVSAEYFKVVGLTLTRGRAFDAHDVDTATRVVVVSEATAQRFWPGEDPIGKRLNISSVAFDGGWVDSRQSRREPRGAFASFEVIGIVPDTRSGWVWERDETMLYLPLPPLNPNWRVTLLKLDGPHGATLPLVSRAAEARGVMIGMGGPLEAARDFQLLPFKGTAVVGASLGLLALLLAVVGLYGVMAFAVSQRAREIGIRVALGATAGKVVGLFVRQGMRLVGIGLIIGSLTGMAVAILISKFVVVAHPFEPIPLTGAVLLLATAGLVACWLPARRASKVDPMVALRAE